ncbi:hypothetical protein [Larkinella sp.]|uniref:hypothetical protein n=1 Tax=Larkinella sp. TaxID=2034517 RepID=UPI003BAB371B
MNVKNLIRVYLILVPFVVAILGFALGHSHYKLYFPIWLIHAGLMSWATWTLSKQSIHNQHQRKSHLLIGILFLIAPWLFIAIFAGMGPPPTTAKGWVATATEQQVRYCILVISGVLMTIGFTFLSNQLKQAGEEVYSLLGLTAIFLAMPLFILNMTYWGSFLTESFRIFVASGSTKRPDWYLPLRDLFAWISGIEVGLTYLASAAFGASLKTTRWFKPRACWSYILISLLGFLLSVLPDFSLMPLTVGSYLVSIPAIPFIIPYLMAVNLLSRSGTIQPTQEI